ncbi:DDE superfamily endonuclease [Kineococcus xinjiangensis]|uniref:DDE superfamily endonuclease n=1 Tax=Kineococcus xinjiangensis TaxID=512762 RepID=A0A2S6IBU3_9ACTN|nr:transposase family protein [Kineococcus xinjiangensis]PPK90165.1 DDE superfamily endonuclease [Kineococcus xinjiangensis]
MLFYCASLDVSRDLAQAIARKLLAHRTRIGTRRGRRALGCFAQAVLLLRFMRQRAAVADLARDNKIALKTAYRYLHEALDVLAAEAPDLPDVVTAAVKRGEEHLLLDGTLIDTDRVHDPGGQRDRWYSGKHRRHGGLVQVLTDADGRPLWVSPVEPGSTHDLTAARVHALPALYAAARHGVPTLADKGYTGAGAGIRVPVRRPGRGQVLDTTTLSWNSYVSSAGAFVEHGIAHLKTRWRALARVTLCPSRISAIIATALVLSSLENRY